VGINFGIPANMLNVREMDGDGGTGTSGGGNWGC